MKSIALIPARYEATRFPGKLMQKLGDKTIIRHTYENSVATFLFDEVIVVTDSRLIFDEIVENGGYAIMSQGDYLSGSDRIAAAAKSIEADIIVNVQGDEPFVKKEPLQKLLAAFKDDPQNNVRVASLMHEIQEETLIANPNIVKVVVDKNRDALLFSRSTIPYRRDKNIPALYYKHIGIYAYRKKALMDFIQWEATPLESAENLEQLRYLENGIKIRMVLTDEAPVSIDTPADLERAKKIFSAS